MTISKSARFLGFVACAVICTVASAPAAAQTSEGHRRGVVTFSNSVQVPGAVLPAGTYVFDHAPGNSAMTVSGSKSGLVVARFSTAPTHRAQRGEHVTFRRTRVGIPPAIAVWYMGGGLEGYELLYTDAELRGFTATPAVTVVP